MRMLFRTVALAGLIALPMTAGASAQSWSDTHPGRARLHMRYARQEWRIAEGLRQGQITRAQAAELRTHIYAVRMQERALGHFHSGHLGPAEYHYLSRELHQNSDRIHDARHPSM